MASTYKVPGRFFDDHMSRHYGEGAYLDYDRDTEKWTGTYAVVTLTDDQFDALFSDAEFYASGGGGFGSEYAGLMRSAAATVRRLDEQRPEVSDA